MSEPTPEDEGCKGTGRGRGSQAVTTRDIVVAGALPRHQVRQYLRALGLEFTEHEDVIGEYFHVPDATEAQWGQIQEWVRKVTG